MRRSERVNGIEFTPVKNDINGNPRYVVHFLKFVNDEDREQHKWDLEDLYERGIEKAREIGGQKYRGKDYGGGIVLQSYNIQDTAERIKKVQQS